MITQKLTDGMKIYAAIKAGQITAEDCGAEFVDVGTNGKLYRYTYNGIVLLIRHNFDGTMTYVL